MREMHFLIDVVGTCNLRCPACPRGNSFNVVNSRDVMSPDTLRRLLEKAVSECVVTHVALFNWTEPLLHPRLPQMVSIVKELGLTCAVSTNLNVHLTEEGCLKLLACELTLIRVSVSGLTQSTYMVTHRGGTIERVLRNLEALARLKETTGNGTRLEVAFHRYLSNLHEEEDLRLYCKSLGIGFRPVWALMLPLEKVLAYRGDEIFTIITEEDQRTIENLALPLSESLEMAGDLPLTTCRLREQQMAITSRGDAMLCCAAYDEQAFVVGNYLRDPLEQIQAIRNTHPACELCGKHGIGNYFLYNVPNMAELSTSNIERRTDCTKVRMIR